MARSVKPTRTSRTGLRRRTSEGPRKTAVEGVADLKAEAREDQGTADTVTAVSGEIGAGTRTSPHVGIRGTRTDGRDADIRYWRETSASPLRRAQRRCVLSGVVHVAASLDVMATAKTRTAAGILRPADGVDGCCVLGAGSTKAIRAFPVVHLQHLASHKWDYGIRTLQAKKSSSFDASTAERMHATTSARLAASASASPASISWGSATCASERMERTELPQVVARFSRRVSSHSIILDSYCSLKKEEPGGSYRGTITISLPLGRQSPRVP